MGVLLVVMFIVFVAIGVPISFALGVVSFTGIASLGQIPNLVVFQKMFNGLNSFTLLAVPLFILAANLMNEGEITEKLIDCCNSLVGHLRGGLAYSNVLVSMIFAGISGSSQADTAGVGKIFIPAMEKQGYDKGTSVGVTAASSTLGSIIPPALRTQSPYPSWIHITACGFCHKIPHLSLHPGSQLQPAGIKMVH